LPFYIARIRPAGANARAALDGLTVVLAVFQTVDWSDPLTTEVTGDRPRLALSVFTGFAFTVVTALAPWLQSTRAKRD